MVEQLCALYAEKETLDASFPGLSAAEIVEAVRTVRDRLRAIGKPSPPSPVIPPASDLPPALSSSDAKDSLEAQLIEMYDERAVLAEAFPGLDADEIAAEYKISLDQLAHFEKATA